MRMIHEIIEDLRGPKDEDRTPLDTALVELLGGARGSLPELADRFTEAGLADVMVSWIGDGPNLPISPDGLRRVLGNERVGDLATLAGLPPEEFLRQLTRLLPEAVHRMTPEGALELPLNRQEPRDG